jgi:hypothetical protein
MERLKEWCDWIMMRTVEAFIVIVIILGAYGLTSYYTALPTPEQVAPINLRRLALTTLETLDTTHDLGTAAFESNNSAQWTDLQVALAASLPANVIYNLTVYDVNSLKNRTQLYSPTGLSTSNTANLFSSSDVSGYTVTSSNVTFSISREKIGDNGAGGTLYILNCIDANGWWITGYTAQNFAEDLYKMLSPYFVNTVLVNTTAQLATILGGNQLGTEIVPNAVIINTCGEAVPIPTSYANQYSSDYTQYCKLLGEKVRAYNWTWASIVGYPFYYVSNTGYFTSSTDQNGWGIYGMKQIGQAGVNAFLQGLDNHDMPDVDVCHSLVNPVTLTQDVLNSCNYYGIYPSSNQTATRALSTSIQTDYHLSVGLKVFNQVDTYLPAALYNHKASGSSDTTGSLLAIGLTRTPDVRITAISLLSYYHPRLFASDYTVEGTSRLVVLQLGLAGGS